MAFQYSDVVVAFSVLVGYAAVSPWLFDIVDKLQVEVDPLTAVIVGAIPALVLIAIILSMGVAARS